jgi:hypothetical protein
LGIAAQQNAAQATDPSVRAGFDQLAAEWFALAEQVEWLAKKHGMPSATFVLPENHIRA